MAILISLIAEATLQSWSVYFKDTTTYLSAIACLQIFMRIEILILLFEEREVQNVLYMIT